MVHSTLRVHSTVSANSTLIVHSTLSASSTHLLLGDGHLVGHVGKHSGLHKVALGSMLLAAGQQARALALRDVNVAQDLHNGNGRLEIGKHGQ